MKIGNINMTEKQASELLESVRIHVMSAKTEKNDKTEIIQRLLNSVEVDSESGWVRPSEWLEIDSLITPGEEKIVALVRVSEYAGNVCELKLQGAYTVDWGDGSAPEDIATDTAATHTYSFASLDDSTLYNGYKQAIVTVIPQTEQHITSAFIGAENGYNMFYGFSSSFLDVYISGTNISTINVVDKAVESVKIYQTTAALTTASYMFYLCTFLQNVDLSNLNTENITSIEGMFGSCSSLETVDLSTLNTSSVTNMSSLFLLCYSLKTVNLSNFDTSIVTYMYNMFDGCYSLETIDLSNFDTSSVLDIGEMFQSCYSLETLNLSNFDTSSVINMGSVFYGCSSLKTLDLSGWDTLSVTNMMATFSGCDCLKTVDLSSSLGFTGTSTYMFENCYLLEKIRFQEIAVSFSVEKCNLNADSLNILFGDLADLTEGVSQEITVRDNPGAATCDDTIATAKKWTVIKL